MDLQYTIPEAFFDDPAHGLARLKLPAATRCGSFRWCGTRVYHVTERIWAITAEWLVVLYFLYLASDGGTDFHDLFT